MTGPEPVEWFNRTGHCGACGQPGDYCTCRQPCPCAHLHSTGSGFAADALDAFVDLPGEQDALFDGAVRTA